MIHPIGLSTSVYSRQPTPDEPSLIGRCGGWSPRWILAIVCAWLALSATVEAQDVAYIDIDGARPAWLTDSATSSKQGDFIVVATAQCPTRIEARRALEAAIRDRIAEQVEYWLPEDARAASWYDVDYVNRRVVGDRLIVRESVDPEVLEHVAELDGDIETAYRGFAKLDFGDHLLQQVQRQLRDQQIQKRLSYWGTGYLALLGVVAIGWMYLRMESATRHHYSHRLQLLAIALMAALAFFLYRAWAS